MNQIDAVERKKDEYMAESLEKALAKIPAKLPPPGMYGRIRSGIDAEIQLRSLRRKAFGFASGFVVLTAVVAVFWSVLAQELAQSAFFDYLKVLWMDRDVVAANWSSIGSSLLESLPVVNLMVWLLFSFFGIGLVWILVQTWSKTHPHNGSNHLAIYT
ncbi:hypothetical protein HZC53_02890 [Candidatus Uhrbacteria bacterium]|nr:hypothetical protein [Candidatus Uhrbacteria bacterium]